VEPEPVNNFKEEVSRPKEEEGCGYYIEAMKER